MKIRSIICISIFIFSLASGMEQDVPNKKPEQKKQPRKLDRLTTLCVNRQITTLMEAKGTPVARILLACMRKLLPMDFSSSIEKELQNRYGYETCPEIHIRHMLPSCTLIEYGYNQRTESRQYNLDWMRATGKNYYHNRIYAITDDYVSITRRKLGKGARRKLKNEESKKRISIYNPHTGVLVKEISKSITTISDMKPLSTTLLAVAFFLQNSIEIWDIPQGKCIKTLQTQTNSKVHLNTSKLIPLLHNLFLLSKQRSKSTTYLTVWDLQKSISSNNFCFSRDCSIKPVDETHFLTIMQNEISLWNVNSQMPLYTIACNNSQAADTHNQNKQRVQITSDFKHLIWATNNIFKVYELFTGKYIHTMKVCEDTHTIDIVELLNINTAVMGKYTTGQRAQNGIYLSLLSLDWKTYLAQEVCSFRSHDTAIEYLCRVNDKHFMHVSPNGSISLWNTASTRLQFFETFSYKSSPYIHGIRHKHTYPRITKDGIITTIVEPNHKTRQVNIAIIKPKMVEEILDIKK